MRAAAVALALVAASAGVARADAPPVVGLLEVRGDGVEDVVVERFAAAVEDGLAGADAYTPAPRSRMVEMLAQSTWSTACLVGPCLTEVRNQTGAVLVVTAGIAGSGQSYRYTITVVETEHGAVVGQVSEACPACTLEDLAAQATIDTIEVIASVPPPDALPAEAEPAPVRGRRHARTLRRTAVVFGGLAVLGAAAAFYFHDKDRDEVSYPLFGAAAGLAASGTVMLGLSLRF